MAFYSFKAYRIFIVFTGVFSGNVRFGSDLSIIMFILPILKYLSHTYSFCFAISRNKYSRHVAELVVDWTLPTIEFGKVRYNRYEFAYAILYPTLFLDALFNASDRVSSPCDRLTCRGFKYKQNLLDSCHHVQLVIHRYSYPFLSGALCSSCPSEILTPFLARYARPYHFETLWWRFILILAYAWRMQCMYNIVYTYYKRT